MAEEKVEKEKAFVLTAEALAAAVEAKDINVKADKVTAAVGGKDYSRDYKRLIAVTPKGAAILVGSIVKVVEHFNYAFDLGVRAKERQALLAAIEGPEKQLAKGVKTLMGLGYTEESAKFTIVHGMTPESFEALPDDWKAVDVVRFEEFKLAQQTANEEAATQQ